MAFSSRSRTSRPAPSLKAVSRVNARRGQHRSPWSLCTPLHLFCVYICTKSFMVQILF